MKYLTASDAAKVLGVSASTVANWCRQGRIKEAYQTGASWVIPESALENIDRPVMGRPVKTEEEE